MSPEHRVSGMVETSDSHAAMAKRAAALSQPYQRSPRRGSGTPACSGNHPETRMQSSAREQEQRVGGCSHLPARTGHTAHEKGIQNSVWSRRSLSLP